MPIEFPCPTCNTKLRAANHLAGRTLRCGQCRATFVVPSAGKPIAASKPPAPKLSPDESRAILGTDSIFDE